jgi:uncharacterized protein YndB with AHSA1/START domain
MLLKIVFVAVAVAVGLVLAVAIIGALLPKGHAASRSVRVHRTPLEVWATVHDVDRFAAWRPGIKTVERLPGAEARPRWKEVGAHGAITFEMVEATPPSKLVTRIADPSQPFGGTWTYVIAPDPDGSTLTITEHGEVYNPVFRFMSRFVFGHTATIDEYLRALGKKFGEDLRPTAA